jgi:integrase
MSRKRFKAWKEFYGAYPVDFGAVQNPMGFAALIRQHKASAKYEKLSIDSQRLRDLACDLLLDYFSEFSPKDILPVHVQAVYDDLSARPATANRRLDDMSSLFAWGRTRGFCEINPCSKIERVESEGSYEPWPMWALKKLFEDGKPHLVQVAIAAIYTGQRRKDIVLNFCPANIENGVWYVKQSKTGNPVPVPLHPVLLAMVAEHEDWMIERGRIDPKLPILKNSRGRPWTTSGFGASWRTERERLNLHEVQPVLTFHGLRTTNATLIANAVAKSPELYGGIERVKAMLGHLSTRMSEHYARHAVAEQKNAETVLLLPDFGTPMGGNDS